MVKSRRMKWAVCVALLERKGKKMGYWWENQNERDH
jgi:hypothetical protein